MGGLAAVGYADDLVTARNAVELQNHTGITWIDRIGNHVVADRDFFNKPRPNYKPYPYPHPLVQLEPNEGDPQRPTNLRVQ